MTAAFYNVQGEGWVLPTSGSLVINHSISTPTVGVNRATGADRLEVAFHQHGDIRGTQDGQPVRYGVDKDLTYWLVPTNSATGPAWAIDGWSGTWSIDQTPTTEG